MKEGEFYNPQLISIENNYSLTYCFFWGKHALKNVKSSIFHCTFIKLS